MGGPVFRYDDEYKSNALFSGTGQLAMANSGKDTDGSQFFITVGPQRLFDLRYTIRGQLLRGFNVLSNILTTATDTNSRPLADVIITRTSFVPDNFDTVLTLTGTNKAGVAGTIKVIADDGAGGRATNFFTATTAADAVNDPPFFNTPAVTNLIIPVNGSVTNVLSAFDVEGNPMYYGAYAADGNAFFSSTILLNNTNGQLVVTPLIAQSFSFTYSFAVSPTNNGSGPVDSQLITFTVGDTAIRALGTSFVAQPLVLISNQLVATFTNGIPNSPTANFGALINWGDNFLSSGLIVTNLNRKEVRGAHIYTNAGNYPVYVTIQSALGVTATAVSTASVPPGRDADADRNQQHRALAGLGYGLPRPDQRQPRFAELGNHDKFLRPQRLRQRPYQRHDERELLFPAQEVSGGSELKWIFNFSGAFARWLNLFFTSSSSLAND